MATFRATLLAVSPCTLCSATEAVPGSFVSLFSGACFTAHTGRPLPDTLSAALGRRLAPDDTGTMLCPRCLRRIDGLDLLQSRRQRLRDELTRVYRTAAEEAPKETPGRGDGATDTCLACHEAMPVHGMINAFWEKTQFSLTTVSDMLSKLMSLSLQPGRPRGDGVCSACVARLNRLDGLTERAEQQCRLIARQYRATHGLTAAAAAAAQHQDSDGVSDEMRAASASDDHLILLSQLDTMLHRLSPDGVSEARPAACRPPPAGAAGGAPGSPLVKQEHRPSSPYDPAAVLEVVWDRPTGDAEDSDPETLLDDADDPETLLDDADDPQTLLDDADDPETLLDDADDPETLLDDADDPETLLDDADDPETLLDDADDPETLLDDADDPEAITDDTNEREPRSYEAVASEAQGNDADDPEALCDDDVGDLLTLADDGCGEGHAAAHGEDADAADEEEDDGMEALMPEAVYSAPSSPGPLGPLGPLRTIYVQLTAGGSADLPRTDGGTAATSSAAAAAAAAAAVSSATTKVAQTVQVVRLGAADRLVPRPRPYRKRSGHLPAEPSSAAEPPPPPPPKRGRGRPRKTNTAVKRQHGVLLRQVRYVTARSLAEQTVEAGSARSLAEPTVGPHAGPGQTQRSPADTDTARSLAEQTVGLHPGPSQTARSLAEPTVGPRAGPGQTQKSPADTAAVPEPAAGRQRPASGAEPTSDREINPKEVAAVEDVGWLGAPQDSAHGSHRRRLAEAMQRVNSLIGEEKLPSRPAAPPPDTTEMWPVSARSRRVNGLYVCEVCQNSYAMLRDILKHEKTHKDAKFPCPICNKKFTLPKLVRKHQKFHKATTSYQCEECGLCCRSQLVLLEHMHEHTGGEHFSCGVCQRTFATRQCYRTHVRVHAGRRPAPECGVCGRRFSDRATLQRHRLEHAEPRLLCPQPDCERRFDTEKRLTHHLLQHVSGPPWRCAVCQKHFKTKYSLRDHTRGHSGDKPFACELCTARFSLRSNLIMHVRYVHQNDRRYECALCGKRFKRRRLLAYHMMAHEGNRPLRCPHCPLQMIYPEHLKQHMRTHSGEKPYRCDVCLKSFSRSDNLKAHMFTHSNKKPFECRQCGLGFMRKTLLLQHMEHLGHGQHPDDYVINRTLVTSELAPPDEEVHTLELVDGEDGPVVMLVQGDGQDEAAAPFLSGEVQYVTADGQRLELIIDETGGGGGGGGGGGSEAAVDLVIEEGVQDVDLLLQGEQQSQLVLQDGGEPGQLVFQGGGGAAPGRLLLQGQDGQLLLQGDGAEQRWLLQDTKDGQQLVLQETDQQLPLAGTEDGETAL